MDEIGTVPSSRTRQLAQRIAGESSAPPVGNSRAAHLSASHAPLVVRQRAWDALTKARARNRPVLVLGEAGLGKSKLLRDFHRSNGTSLIVHALPGDVRVPYGLLTRLIGQLIPLYASPLPAGVRSELARLIPSLGEPPPANTGLEAAQARFHAAVDTLLEGVGTRASASGLTAIVVEDIHYADLATMEAVQRLICSSCGIHWVLSGRSLEITAPVQEICSELALSQKAETVSLLPLDEAAVSELLSQVGFPSERLGAWSHRLLRHTGGNPLFLLETVKSLTEDMLSASGEGALPFPSTAVGLIKRRLETLDTPALRLAQLAAVAGQQFCLSMACEVLDKDANEILQLWAQLEEESILDGEGFAHDLVMQAAKECTPTALVRQLHRRVAEYLTDRKSDDSLAAEHWSAAGEPAKAGHAYRRAAEQAFQRLRLKECIDLFDRAAEAFQKVGNRTEYFNTLLRAITPMEAMGFFAEEEDHFARLSEAADNEEQRLVASAEFCIYLIERSHRYAEARQYAETTLERVSPHLHDHIAVAIIKVSLANYLMFSGQLDAAQELLREAGPIVGCQGSDREKNVLLATNLWYCIAAEKYSECVRLAERACAVKGPPGGWNHLDKTSLVFPWGAALVCAGRCRDALRLYQDLCPPSEDDGWMYNVSLLTVLECQIALGMYAEAIRTLDIVKALSHAYGPHVVRSRVMEAQLLLYLGRTEEALAIYDGLQQHPNDRLDPLFSIVLAEVNRNLGRSNEDVLATVRSELDLEPEGPTFRIAFRRRRLALSLCIEGSATSRYSRASAILREASATDSAGQQLVAHLRCCQAALDLGNRAAAVAHAEQILAMGDSIVASEIYQGELRWILWSALSAAGDSRSSTVLEESMLWVARMAEESIPDRYKASFLSGNRFNRLLREEYEKQCHARSARGNTVNKARA